MSFQLYNKKLIYKNRKRILNYNGSISIMMLIIICVFCTVFWIYMSFLSDIILGNAVSRAASCANRNIQACYNPQLYDEYGILAYDADSAKIEMMSTFQNQLTNGYKSILPFSNADEIGIEFEADKSLLNADQLLNQCIEQACIYVPMEFIQRTESYKGIIQKFINAKRQIQRNEDIFKGIRDLERLHKKYSKSIKKLDKLDSVFKLRLLSQGKIKIKMNSLNSAISNTSNLISSMDTEKKNIEPKIEKEKLRIQSIKDEFPEGFAESSMKILEMSSDDVDAENYRDMQIKLNDLKESADKFELQINEDYEDDIQDIRDEDDYRERKKLKKRLKRDLNDELESWLDDLDFEVDESHVDEYKDKDISLQNYVDDLNNDNEAIIADSEDINIDSLQNLYEGTMISNKKIDDATWEYLRNQDIDFADVPNWSAFESACLTEYIMGCFRHRLSDEWCGEDNEDKSPQYRDNEDKDPKEWDFYDKFGREAFFENGEIEYIISRNRSEDINRKKVAAKIYITRQMFNLFHVYMSDKKKSLAESISIAVSWQPWMIPAIKHGILIAWASVESYDDVDKLLHGKSIPTLKLTDDDWSTKLIPDDIELEEDDANQKTELCDVFKEHNDQNYSFYLRIYLTGMSIEDKLSGICDLLALNLEDDLDSMTTAHTICVQRGDKSYVFPKSYKK